MNVVLVLIPLLLGILESNGNHPDPSAYCQPQLCEKGQEHVACNYYSKLKETIQHACHTTEMRIVYFTVLKDKVLELHNERRYRLANGNASDLPEAARMVTMQWSPELATLAEFNAHMCMLEHDECRNVAQFPQAGQNVFVVNMKRLVPKKEMIKLYPELLANATEAWWSESENITSAEIKKFPCDHKKPKAFRYFATMAVESNSHVGCAGVRYVMDNTTQFKLTCNYARAPVCGQPIYQAMPGCQAGKNEKFSALCSPNELFL
ncbi:venom allergen 3-like [Drosophila serrata]|uniref:venom allergen 3-like n=1 Tax=Drosophila serrata TaxID=7274 RepID=UPI000A1CFC51|nr:venom allergen 3-like [Drosophila serrata]